MHLSTMEFILIATILFLVFIIIRLWRELNLVRMHFITSSDWCADKISEMQEDSESTVIELAMQLHKISEKEARDWIPFSVLGAKDEWKKQKNDFQKNLIINGFTPLTEDDFLVSLSSWVKHF